MPSIVKYTSATPGRVERLIQFILSNKFYFVISKPTPWDNVWGDDINDSNPPTPSKDSPIIAEPIIIKSPLYINPIVESQCGDIEFDSCGELSLDGKRWSLLDISSINRELLYKLMPSKVYFHLEIDTNDLISNTFRILSLHNQVSLNANVNLNQIRYSASDVYSYGTVHWVSYFTPLSINQDKKTTFKVLLDI